jgi:hypothetical protein
MTGLLMSDALSLSILRINIDQSWELEDFRTLFGVVNNVYTLCTVDLLQPYTPGQTLGYRYDQLGRLVSMTGESFGASGAGEKLPRSNITGHGTISGLREMYKFSQSYQPLLIKRLQFGSKGFTDIVGIGTIVKEARLLLSEWVKYCLEAKSRSLEISARTIDVHKSMQQLEQTIIETEQKKIALAYKRAELLKKLGWTKEEIRAVSLEIMNDIDFIERTVHSGQLLSVEEVQDPQA